MRLLVLALLVGCGGSPTCEDAFRSANGKLEWSDKELAFAVTTCNKLGLSGDTRKCVAAAASEHDLTACLEKDPDVLVELSRQQSDEAAVKAKLAEQQAQEAMEAAKKAQDDVAQLSRELIELGHKVDAATDALAAAQTDADRTAARAKLDELRKERAALEARMQAAKDAAARAEHRRGVHIDPKCLDNPLAPGC